MFKMQKLSLKLQRYTIVYFDILRCLNLEPWPKCHFGPLFVTLLINMCTSMHWKLYCTCTGCKFPMSTKIIGHVWEVPGVLIITKIVEHITVSVQHSFSGHFGQFFEWQVIWGLNLFTFSLLFSIFLLHYLTMITFQTWITPENVSSCF